MRQVELKTASVIDPKNGREHDFPYAELAKVACENMLPTEHGFNIAKQRNLLRILDRIDDLEPGATHLLLEDADWALLRDRCAAFEWAFPHRGFVVFADDVAAAEEVKAVAPAKPKAKA